MARGKRAWLLVGLVGLAFAVRVAGLDSQSLWRDEVDAIRFATLPGGDLLGMFVMPGQNGPLYYLLLRPWLALAGLSEYALRFFSVFFGTLAVPLIHSLTRRIFPTLPSLALLAAVLTATSPYLIWYSQEGKMYSLVLVLALLSMDRYLAALERGGWQRWLLYVAVTGTTVYVHFVAALLVPVQIVSFLLMGSETRKARWRGWLGSMGLLVLPYLPLLRWQVPLALSPAETGYAFAPLHKMLVSLFASYSLGPAAGSLTWAAFLFVALLLAAWLLWREDRSHLASLGILTGWLCIPVLGLFLVTLIRPMYTARYLIFVLPAYLILLAVGLVAIARRSRLLAGPLLAALLVSNSLMVWRQAATPMRADFRAATEYVASRMSRHDLLIFQIPYGRYSFDYYLERYRMQQQREGEVEARSNWDPAYRVFAPLVASDGAPYRWADGLYTNGGMGLEAVSSSMERLTADVDTVWLIATEVEMWDEEGLVQGWLGRHATLAEQAHFVRVSVYRYSFR